jgi:hypothetical protein
LLTDLVRSGIYASQVVVNGILEIYFMPRQAAKRPVNMGEFHIRVAPELGRQIREIADSEGRDYNIQIERLLKRGLEAEKAA